MISPGAAILSGQSRDASRHRSYRWRLLAVIAAAILMLAACASRACAAAPFWRVTTEAAPTHLPPGGEGAVIVAVTNLGDEPVNGAMASVQVTDKLPPGLTATAMIGEIKGSEKEECTVATLTCSFKGVVNPYERLAATIKVRVQAPSGPLASVSNEVSVEGGGAARTSSTQQLTVSPEPTPFGLQRFELMPTSEDGAPATQAGSHPFQLTTTLVMNQTAGRSPIALPKDLSFNLPPGLVGDANLSGTPTEPAQCSEVDFAALVDETNLCPPSSVVGVATVVANEPIAGIVPKTVPVFNLVPAQGEPARFGIEVIGKIPIVIDTSVRSGRDYGVVATVRNATQVAGLLSSQVTLWGVPGDPRHNNSRGWECVEGGYYDKQVKKSCPTSTELPQEAFLTMPTSCPASPAEEPLSSSMEADSWADPGSFLSAEYAWLSETGHGLSTEGCSELPFSPEIKVSPEQHTASTPTGLSVDVRLPQRSTLEAQGLAEADVRDTTVTLPEGVQLSPAAANGLQACSEAEIGFIGLNPRSETNEFTSSRPSCPEASKVGVVHIKTPLLGHELEGSVYLAEQDNNPFGSLIALYIVAEDPVSGVLVKLAGEGSLNEANQQISTSFKNTPQVPFEDLRLELFGGPRASLSTPPDCGEYRTAGSFTPWSGTPAVNPLSSGEEFAITAGPGGGACSYPQPFSPGFLAQSTNPQAGAFTSFVLELTRPDGQQAIDGLSLHLPAGNAAMLSSVSLCPEAQAAQGSCPASSEVGRAVESAGLGPEPYLENGGRVFITGPYHGAPFGLSIVTPAVAGPFNLGVVVVRSRIFINPSDASITIVSDPLPTQLKGIPLQLKRIEVFVDRPNFEFNPTSCNLMKVDGAVAGAQGANAAVSALFRVENCARLPFTPKLAASTKGQASKANGANFDVRVESKGLGQANIAKVRLQLPKALPARLTTLQKACTEGAFNANPASCPEGSLIGSATIHTPVLRSALSGPAYLVSHGGAAFPDVEFVLQGEGITLVLDGKTQISKQITYSKFESAPDAPFTAFETVLPAGPHSALTANLPEKAKFNLCSTRLSMPTEIVGQNGVVLKQSTRIALQGCQKVKMTRPLSRAQLLKRALAACRKQHKRSKARRQACERQARKRYLPGRRLGR